MSILPTTPIMDFEEQRRRAIDLLKRKGYPRRAADPPHNVVLRALGVKVRPFPFEPFWRIVAWNGAWFTLFWGFAMWFWRWRDEGMVVAAAVIMSMLTGLFFGVSMACYTVYSKRKHGLPSWESLAAPLARPHAERET